MNTGLRGFFKTQKPGSELDDAVTSPVETGVRSFETRAALSSDESDGLRSAKWVSAEKMVALVKNGDRWEWRVCNECATFDRFRKRCEVLRKPTEGGASCDFWRDISY
ncbi:hypothetical protein [Ferrovum sp.]|jgi:hypothetical protein|uniref:hypothetical protein n=1 Tax=Ferrovum sp. TaxID=2609467 RepID=UPI00261115D2|nr:hypothetical protein [Ferrovum sp.]